MSRLRRDEASLSMRAERDTSPDVLEEASEESAVESEVSPFAREVASPSMRVERDTSPDVLEDASDVTAVPTDVTMDVMVVWKLASSLRAAASSSSVSSAAGAPLMRFVIAVLTSTEIFVERDASPDVLEDISEERAVERDASAFCLAADSTLSRLRRVEVTPSTTVESETSPDALEDTSEESAVESETSPDAREEVSEERAVERDASAF